jgi:hypothetical protein
MRYMLKLLGFGLIIIMVVGCVGSAPATPSQGKMTETKESAKKCPPGSSGIVTFKDKQYCKTSTTDKEGNPQSSYVAPESIGDPTKMDMWIVAVEDGKTVEVHYQAGKSAETYVDGVLKEA